MKTRTISELMDDVGHMLLVLGPMVSQVKCEDVYNTVEALIDLQEWLVGLGDGWSGPVRQLQFHIECLWNI